MKLEEVNQRTKEAVDFLVAALESGHSEVLTAHAVRTPRQSQIGAIATVVKRTSTMGKISTGP